MYSVSWAFSTNEKQIKTVKLWYYCTTGNRIQMPLNSLVIFLFFTLSPSKLFHGDTLFPNNLKHIFYKIILYLIYLFILLSNSNVEYLNIRHILHLSLYPALRLGLELINYCTSLFLENITILLRQKKIHHYFHTPLSEQGASRAWN